MLENSKIFSQAFKGTEDIINEDLRACFDGIKCPTTQLVNLEFFLTDYSREIAKFLKAKAKEELNKAQANFEFVKDL